MMTSFPRASAHWSSCTSTPTVLSRQPTPQSPMWRLQPGTCCVAPCQRFSAARHVVEVCGCSGASTRTCFWLMLFSSRRNCTCPALLPYSALEKLFSHISHSFLCVQRGEGHEKVLSSAKKLLAPATGMFRQEEFWYFEDLANLESDGFRLSRSSGHGHFFMLLPTGYGAKSPDQRRSIDCGDQLDVPLMRDFKFSSQTKSDRIEPSCPSAGYVFFFFFFFFISLPLPGQAASSSTVALRRVPATCNAKTKRSL